LSKDDFELRVDSKLQPLSLFEEVLAGSVDEEKQIAAARKGDAAALARLQQASRPQTARGRVIFFFVDDVRLTSDALARARSVISHFIEDKMTDGTGLQLYPPAGKSVFYSSSPITKPYCAKRSAVSTPNTILRQPPARYRSVK